MPLDDSWARDIGPTFVTGPVGRAAVQWHFNAWGNKYHPFDEDAAFADARSRKRSGVPLRRGAAGLRRRRDPSDGQGTLLTTEQCLLNPNRNPDLTQQMVPKQVLRDFTGARRMIWLGEGFCDDETDGHVDNIACFAALAGCSSACRRPNPIPTMRR